MVNDSTLIGLKSKTLEEIFTGWFTDLSSQVSTFKSHANTVSEWDRLIISQGGEISKLDGEVGLVKSMQQDIEQNLEYIHSQQNELEGVIQELEKALEVKDRSIPGLPADEEREKL